MTSDGKIDEAERWLDKIRNSDHRKDRTALNDNVNAFLNAVNSIPDHLLEEYQQKFGLGVTFNDELRPRIFENVAKKQGNGKALSFILAFNQEKAKVESDSIGKILSRKRDLDTHRDSQKPNKLVVVVGGIKDPNDDFSVNFPEFSGNVDDVCKKLLDMMKDFVSRLRNQFP